MVSAQMWACTHFDRHKVDECNRNGTADEWGLLLPAVLASASMRAAQGWLGYCPPAIQFEASHLLEALDAGEAACTAARYLKCGPSPCRHS
jgi:hypothetical protein